MQIRGRMLAACTLGRPYGNPLGFKMVESTANDTPKTVRVRNSFYVIVFGLGVLNVGLWTNW